MRLVLKRYTFLWTKTAEEILESLAKYIAKISGAGH